MLCRKFSNHWATEEWVVVKRKLVRVFTEHWSWGNIIYHVLLKNITMACMFQNILAKTQGAVSIRKTVLPGMAIPMLKIRRPNGRLIFNMEIPIPGKDGLYIETGPWYPFRRRYNRSSYISNRMIKMHIKQFCAIYLTRNSNSSVKFESKYNCCHTRK